MRGHFVLAMALSVACAASTVAAGEANVIGVEVSNEGGGSYRFDVTVEHADEGWDHYADAWDVVAPDGTLLGTRTLLHPHENEQPFTRSLNGVAILEGITEVTIRARDSVHEFGGAEVTVTLPAE
ncbi:MAG: hypothetical protein ACR2RA_23410 [Geminicoccaceae bacterium]